MRECPNVIRVGTSLQKRFLVKTSSCGLKVLYINNVNGYKVDVLDDSKVISLKMKTRCQNICKLSKIAL